MTKFQQLMLMEGAMLSIVLFCIPVFLLFCRLCMMTLDMALLFICISMWGASCGWVGFSAFVSYGSLIPSW
jgi:hypothetical protein